MLRPNKLARTVLIFFPVLFMALNSVLQLSLTGIRSLIYLAFNWPNYWTLENEWFQVTEEFKMWYTYWKTGMS